MTEADLLDRLVWEAARRGTAEAENARLAERNAELSLGNIEIRAEIVELNAAHRRNEAKIASLKAELLRVADQGEQTCVALRDLIAAANGGSVRFHTSKIREALERGEKHLETLDQEIPF